MSDDLWEFWKEREIRERPTRVLHCAKCNEETIFKRILLGDDWKLWSCLDCNDYWWRTWDKDDEKKGE